MILGMRKRASSRDEWRRVIAEQAGSGMSIAAYCRQRRVPEASFFAWRRKLRDPVQFAEVRVAAEPLRPAVAAAEAASGIELRLASGRCILVRAGFDPRTLLELVATLEAGR